MLDSQKYSGLTPFVLPEIVLGMIVSWSGAIVAIPSGWSLCDGTNGTPDLRDKFVQGAGGTFAVNQTGGVASHRHLFTSDTHRHATAAGAIFTPGGSVDSQTSFDPATGQTDLTASPPPFYSLAYIQFTG